MSVATVRPVVTGSLRHPRGRPSSIGAKKTYRGFVFDQDAGGAIRAPGRCDLYLGVGDEAGDLAGRAKNEGRLYYLFLKPAAMPSGALRTPEASGG